MLLGRNLARQQRFDIFIGAFSDTDADSKRVVREPYRNYG